MSKTIYTIAVIGGGPRGLAALEYLHECLALHSLPFMVKTVLFEPDSFPGAGPVYSPDQSPGNWLNIPERLVDVKSRADLACKPGVIPGFPSYQDWAEREGACGIQTRVDLYPQRALLGKYLAARFSTLADGLRERERLTIMSTEVESMAFHKSRVTITCADGTSIEADEVVLTIGHQPVEPDESMVRWRTYSEERPQLTLISDPYPTSSIMESTAIHSQSTVAIRGFGLAMIDVVKGLTEARGGEFIVSDEQTRSMTYTPSGYEPLKMVPFSLDGLPLVPKPVNASVDQRFEPDRSQLRKFEEQCRHIAAAQEDITDPLHDLIDSVSSIQASQFLALGNIARAHSLSFEQLRSIARNWLADAEYQHELIVSTELPAVTAMRAYSRMACELEPCSFDYCQGQVWRYLQPIMFQCLSHTRIGAEATSDILDLHERMKRYSYGPPVDSTERLLALSEIGLLSFVVVDDPDIELTSSGWNFHAEQRSVCADVMIDSVLASPDLEKVSSPLIRQLRNDQWLVPFADSLGARTTTDGRVVNQAHDSLVPLAILGRLAKGSLFGTDSLTESFGHRQRDWAVSLAERLSNRENPVIS